MDTIVNTIRLVKRSPKDPSHKPTALRSRVPPLREAVDRTPVLLHDALCVRAALDTLANDGIQAALVVDDCRRPRGEFTQRTALSLLASGAYHDRVHEGCRKLRHVMRAGALIVDEQEDPFALAARLASGDREVAAIMRDGALVGCVSRTGLLSLLAQVHDPGCGPRERTACQEQRMP